MADMGMQFTVQFNKRLLSRLEQLTSKQQNSVQSKSIRAAMKKTVFPEARRRVPKQSKALWRNLTVSVKRERGTVFMTGRVIGRNKKDPKTGRNPARYLHLVEGGTKPHSIFASAGKRLAIGGNTFPTEVHNPGTRPQRFLENAFSVKWRQMQRELEIQLEKFIAAS